MNENKDIELIEQDLAKFEKWIEPIIDQDSCIRAADNLKGIKITIKTIDEKRTQLVKPINDSVKRINEMFRPYLAKAEQIKDELSKNILEYQREQVRIQREEEEKARKIEMERLLEEQKRIEEEALNKNSEVVIDEAIKIEQKIAQVESAASLVKAGVKGQFSSTSIRENWTYEIINHQEVPVQFCSPDHAKIQAAIKAGTREIPGLNIFDKGSIASY